MQLHAETHVVFKYLLPYRYFRYINSLLKNVLQELVLNKMIMALLSNYFCYNPLLMAESLGPLQQMLVMRNKL